MRIALISTLLVSAAAPLAAECYTAADLGRGVQVNFAGGEVYEIRRDGQGNVVIVENYNDGSNAIRFRSDYGIYVKDEVEVVDGRALDETRIVIDYGVNEGSLPEPTPGGTWRGDTTNIFADGGRRPEVFSATFSGTDQIALEGCTYDVIYADLRYDWPDIDSGMTLQYAYLPALGAAFLITSQFDGDEVGTPNQPVSITPMQK